MQQRGCCRGPRPADLSTHAERASSEEAVVCQLGGNHCCLDAERPLHRHTLPPCVRSNICQSSREGSWRHRWQWIRQTPIAAPRLASSSANAFFERAAGMSQHNQGSAQPRCCTSRVNRESARTGNIARPFVVSVDDVSPTQPPTRPGDCGPAGVEITPRLDEAERDRTRQGPVQTRRSLRPGVWTLSGLPAAQGPPQKSGFYGPRQLAVSWGMALSFFAHCLRRALARSLNLADRRAL